MNYEGAKRKFDVAEYETQWKTPTEPTGYYSLAGYSQVIEKASKKRKAASAKAPAKKAKK